MTNFLCPVCQSPLDEKESCSVCQNGHVFDKAKEGYYYLLTPDKRNSKDPGDNKEMICARRDFLDGGYYAPLADCISQIVCNIQKPITLVDAGTGTGFYMSQIIKNRNNDEDVYFGVDISKHAVKIASKRNKRAKCAVASVYDLPLPSKCADVIVCVFSPYAVKEYARVLKDDGILIVAYPCENHLIELRRALYQNVREVATVLPESDFESVEEKELTVSFDLNKKGISDLLAMTPYVYRAPNENIEKLQRLENMTLTADFHVSVLKKSTR